MKLLKIGHWQMKTTALTQLLSADDVEILANLQYSTRNT